MNDLTPTDEQHTAWQTLSSWNPVKAALIAPFVSDALKNSQPVLPTKPGLYASHTDPDAAWKLHKDGDWWPPYQDYSAQLSEVHAAAPFNRLVPERPRITREQIKSECGRVGGMLPNDTAIERILNLVNGPHS